MNYESKHLLKNIFKKVRQFVSFTEPEKKKNIVQLNIATNPELAALFV